MIFSFWIAKEYWLNVEAFQRSKKLDRKWAILSSYPNNSHKRPYTLAAALQCSHALASWTCADFNFNWMTSWLKPLFSFKKVCTSPTCLGVRAFQTCQGVWPYMWNVRVVHFCVCASLAKLDMGMRMADRDTYLYRPESLENVFMTKCREALHDLQKDKKHIISTIARCPNSSHSVRYIWTNLKPMRFVFLGFIIIII